MNDPAQGLRFKLATEDAEIEQIHELNYRTFVEEIPQHAQSINRRLVDKFHHENTYAICLDGERVVGMVAVRGNRPFSLDKKLPNLDSHLPPGHRVCEVRLLSVEKEYRTGQVFCGLVGLVLQYCEEIGYTLAIISGTVRQQKLYRHLGFMPFGPLVGSADAQFQPMYLTHELFEENARSLLQLVTTPRVSLTNFLPGPVEVHPDVQEAFSRMPVSHRAVAFESEFQATKKLLCGMTNARQVEIFLGSGTLANDAVAAQLSLTGQPGLVLSNGEFGERLIDQATRAGLAFDTLRADLGEAFDPDRIDQQLSQSPKAKWLWAVHCETSTSMLNDLPTLKQLCARHDVRLCLDCISSIGTIPVDLRAVFLASCVSGKGLASYPGLSMVFYNHNLLPAPSALPRYLDLGYYAAQHGVPFTHSSNLVTALRTALKRVNWNEKFRNQVELSVWLRAQLVELGYDLVATNGHTSPAVVTLALPKAANSRSVGWRLQKAGFLLNYRSEYLARRNWIQICMMNECSREKVEPLVHVLPRVCTPRPGETPELAQTTETTKFAYES
jgi:aspartate aminotransferase-like enzyme